MRKRSDATKKKAAAKRGESAAKQESLTADLFETAPDQKADPGRKPGVVVPPLPSPIAGLVETTFSVGDPEALYAELEAALDRRSDALTPGVLRDLLADSPRLYREAHRLYITARLSLEQLDLDYAQVQGAMWEEAARVLEKEKTEGLRSKAATKDDIEYRMGLMYRDEVKDLRERQLKARKTVEHLNHLVDVFKARGFALKALVGGREEL